MKEAGYTSYENEQQLFKQDLVFNLNIIVFIHWTRLYKLCNLSVLYDE